MLEIRGANVRASFEVDPDLALHRLQVWERINSNNQPSGAEWD